MTSDDSKQWHKEKTSPSSPDYFRKDIQAEKEKLAKEAQNKQELSLLRLQMDLERKKQQEDTRSRPAKEKRQEIASAKEDAGSTKEFLEKVTKREEEREEAKKQSSPEEQAGGPV